MNDPILARLQEEHTELVAALPRLAAFVDDHQAYGDPPTCHRLALRPFGFRVRRGASADGAADDIATWDPAQHGAAELLLSADPDRYPWRPWQATVLLGGDLGVVSPHVANVAGARGLCCWLGGTDFVPNAHPALAVLLQVLRILAGEVYELEGFALAEDMKVWFARHRQQLPFARVPEVRAPGAGADACLDLDGLAASDGAAAPALRSALGIEFPGGRP